jgi:hypothetical protein
MKETVDTISIVMQHLRHQAFKQLSPGPDPGMLRIAGCKYFQPCHIGLSSSTTHHHSNRGLPADNPIRKVLMVMVYFEQKLLFCQ